MLNEHMLIDHINRHVSDVDAFISFYADALGFRLLDNGIKSNGKKYAILQNGGFEMFISERDGFSFDNDTNFRHLGFNVDSADRMLADLKARGYVPASTKIIVKAFSRQFLMKDPDGFELDFIQWTDKAGFYRHLAEKSAADSY